PSQGNLNIISTYDHIVERATAGTSRTRVTAAGSIATPQSTTVSSVPLAGPGPLAGPTSARSLAPGEHDFAEGLPAVQALERITDGDVVVEVVPGVDHGSAAGGRQQSQEVLQLGAGSHGAAHYAQAAEEDPVQIGRGGRSAGGAGHGDHATGVQAAQGMLPGGLSHGLDHCIHARDPAAGLHRFV